MAFTPDMILTPYHVKVNTPTMSTLSNDQLMDKYKQYANEGGPLHGKFEVVGVMDGNYKVDGLNGHPFTIGPSHVQEASDHHSGMLTREVCEKIGCAHHVPGRGKCNRPVSAHTSEKILLVNLCRDLGNKEAADALFAIKKEMEKDDIAGVGFACRFKQFKIAPPEKEVEE